MKIKRLGVSAINGGQLLVEFSKEVDKNSAENSANYTLTKNTISGIKLQEDGKSVVITLGTVIDKDSTQTLAVTVEDVLVKGSLTEKFPLYTQSVTISDKVAPTATKVEAKTAGTHATSVSVTFSEPVQQPTVKVNGTTYAFSLADDNMSGTIQNVSLDANKTHTLEFVNLTDLSNNVTDTQKVSFNVTKDVAAPTFAVTTVSDKRIKLTFNKAMDVDTVKNGVVLKKEDLNDLNLTTQFTINESAVASEKGKVFYVDVVKAGFDPFAAKNSYDFTVLVKNTVKDSLGNKAIASSQKVTLTKDTTAPTLAGIDYIKNASGEVTILLLKYDEEITLNGLALSDLTATNVITGATIDAFSGSTSTGTIEVLSDGKTIKVPLNSDANEKIRTGRVEVAVAADKVTDIALTANNAKAAKKIVDFGAAAAGSLKATVSSVASSNVVSVTFDNDVTYESATNPANYTLNGLPLPANTVITWNNAKSISITLPAEFVKSDDTGAVFRVQNVSTSTGVKVSANQTVITVADNAGPIISKDKSAVNSNGTLTLGFDEKVIAIGTLTSAEALEDLKITLDGVSVATKADTGITPKVVITNGEGADAGKYVLSFTATAEKSTGTSGNDETVTVYFDADGDDTYNATKDILIKRSTGLSVAERDAVHAAAATTLNLNTISSIVVGTQATTANIKDTATTPNVVLKNQSVVIK